MSEVSGLAPELRTRTALLIGLVLFVLYLPLAWWINRGYVPVARPAGRVVELLLDFQKREGLAFRAYTYAFKDLAAKDYRQSPIVVYENTTPLRVASDATEIVNSGAGRYLQLIDPRRSPSSLLILLATSDNSDPRTNGRRYWAVLPH